MTTGAKCAWCGLTHNYEQSWVVDRHKSNFLYDPTLLKWSKDSYPTERLYFCKHACRNQFLYGM
ncbi:hypothetical protein FDI69_gp237 [Rhodococcus phage Trina]|uniref:Uncharacterized protein n=1 Tax=Rhodococcus phage Trina TaxID=2027905 RepID=A0A2D1A750_9CAUD|nr:hypothetical protein FDI69_gp237 [Rhodococcus phage Trina]ASZ75070.1 hypothetical protein SEA_TRINA_149 [Rhodococcus phage Trina]